jgi:serine phosphatase RsbU (regulator of sigma subunit)
MDTLETTAGSDIQQFVATKLSDILDSYSILKVGHITRFTEPISCSVEVSEAISRFEAQDDIDSLPVEGDRGVIGLVHKKDVLKKKGGFMGMSDPLVEKFLDKSSFSVDATESCEKAMDVILERDRARIYDDFMIFKQGRFFGTGTFTDLTRNIAAIKSMDLEKAKKLQNFLMTRNTITRQEIVIEQYVKMAHELGGDYLTCMDISDSLSMLSCFDVCGKGTAAALITSTISSFFSTLKACGTLSSYTPANLVSALNAMLMEQTPEEVFVAAALVFIDWTSKSIFFFNCGYSPLYVFFTETKSGKPKGKIVNPNLWPLGINEFDTPPGSILPIEPNLRLFMYSDGLTDACNEEGERYGDDRLRKFLYARYMQGASSLITDLDEELNHFVGDAPRSDDITAMVAEIT